jgi:hypothetical protein
MDQAEKLDGNGSRAEVTMFKVGRKLGGKCWMNKMSRVPGSLGSCRDCRTYSQIDHCTTTHMHEYSCSNAELYHMFL